MVESDDCTSSFEIEKECIKLIFSESVPSELNRFKTERNTRYSKIRLSLTSGTVLCPISFTEPDVWKPKSFSFWGL